MHLQPILSLKKNEDSIVQFNSVDAIEMTHQKEKEKKKKKNLIKRNMFASVWPYYSIYAVVALCLVGELIGDSVGGKWWTPLIAFALLPLLDWLLGVDVSNPSNAKEIRALESQVRFRVVTWLWLPLQLGLIAFACHDIWRLAAVRSLRTTDWLAAVLSAGIGTGAIGINVAHELIHRRGSVERWMGKVLLASVCYGHWSVEHVYGHHRRVGLADDPNTARRGESLWRFVARSVCATAVHSVQLERALVARRRCAAQDNGASTVGIADVLRYSDIVYTAVMSVAFLALAYAAFGVVGAALFLMQSALAIFLLEAVNYIEHYGLTRQPGESISIAHSWNASQRLSNALVFKLQRHTDHHLVASRRYQALLHHPSAPQHPFGYPTMILIALVPPLWRYIVDHRLDLYHQSQK
jgi:alkane 1-monooxygenase